ncbi:outer membrane protein assembly factor BamB family protein [Maioricimonas rarisocia]|uniref:outer membrane protein assembly factor BamB family protein n=1 Tax=Maioricimonas rarisocia TaxID=2528026 RepID=UPI0018D25A13|nr:PQQ-binding-like beta-propeller repeat protein [Maioricimonas rarisocia]
MGIGLLAIVTPGSAGDWPQILGPNRDGRAADDEVVSTDWEAAGPPVVWEKQVGSGYAGVAVKQGQAILFHRVGDEERVAALDAGTGQTLWSDGQPSDFRPQVGGENGPLCVPVIAGTRVITFGAQGILSCHDVKSGKLLWRRDTHEDFGAREGYFGAGSTPLVEENRVVVNVGGFRSGAGIVAFDLQSGQTLWQATDEQGSYSAPVATTVDGKRLVIAVTRLKCVGLDPASGEIRFETRFGQRGPTVNAASPVLLGDRMFLTASYGIGARWMRVRASSLEELWESDQILSSQYTTCVEHEGVLFGVDGRQDLPPANLVCIDPARQKVLWSVPDFGYATLILADGKLVIVKTDGELVVADASSKEFKPLGRARVLTGTARALPALANGRLYVRNDETLRCLQIGSSAAAN